MQYIAITYSVELAASSRQLSSVQAETIHQQRYRPLCNNIGTKSITPDGAVNTHKAAVRSLPPSTGQVRMFVLIILEIHLHHVIVTNDTYSI